MKKLLALLAAGSLLALTTGCPPGTTSSSVPPPGPGASGTPGPNPNPNPAKEGKEATGKVKSAAKDKVVITDSKDKDWPLDVTADTKVTLDGHDTTADKLPAGASVTASIDKDGKVTKIAAAGGAAPNPNPAKEGKEATGKVKSAAKDKVVITDSKDKDWPLDVTADTKVTLDGHDTTADKLPAGASVTASIDKDGKVTKIEATGGAAPPLPPPPANESKEAKGTVKSAAKDKVVITDVDKKDWPLDVTADTKVTVDGKDSTADKIPVGSEVTATLKDGKATKIDATKPK